MNAIITGASRGIGREVAEKFAATHHLYLCARNKVQLDDTVTTLQNKYPASVIKTMPADLSIKEQALGFGSWVLEETSVTGGPLVLVNNAGTFIPGSIYNEEDGALETMIETNLFSAYHVTRKLLPAMIANRKGHIFNLCSIASLQAYSNGGAYSISKFALLGFSRNLREEMKPYGIKVTAVIPGAVYTDSWKGSGVPPERIMETNDVAVLIYAAACLSPQAVVEDIVIRPQLGDL